MDRPDRRRAPAWSGWRAGSLVALAGAMTAASIVGTFHLATGSAAVEPRWFVVAGLVAAFAVVERVVIHAPIRRSSHTITLDEIPFVVALAFLPPHWVIGSRLVGGAIGLLSDRSLRSPRAAYSFTCYAASSVAATLVFDRLVGDRSLDDPLTWPVAGFSTVLAGCIGMLAIYAAIWLTEGRPPTRRFLESAGLSTASTMVNTLLGILAATALLSTAWSLVLIASPCAAVAVAYQSWVRERALRRRLTVVSDVMAAMARADRPEQAVVDALARAARALDARTIEMTVRSSGAEIDQYLTLRDGSISDEPVTAGDRFTVSIETDDGTLGSLTVADRVAPDDPFTAEDRALVEALAGQIGTAMRRERIGAAFEALERRASRLEEVSRRDPLTGLANRLALTEHFNSDAALDAASIVMVDLDGFKPINDSFGHAAGDELLVHVATRLLGVCGPDDLVCRQGGDEFVIVSRGPGVELAESIVAALVQPFAIQGHVVSISACAGVATTIADSALSVCLARADEALYAAKRAGRGRVWSAG